MSAHGVGSLVCATVEDTVIIIGILLPIGTLLSGIPQAMKIRSNNHSDGIALDSIMLSVVSNIFQMLSYILLHLDGLVSGCLVEWIPFIQLLAIVVALWGFVLLVECYTRSVNINEKIRSRGLSMLIGLFFIISAIIIAHNAGSTERQTFAVMLTIVAAIITTMHGIPQLWMTWKTRSLGSLSETTLVLQIIGSGLTAYHIGHEHVWVAVPYLISSATMITLVVMSNVLSRIGRPVPGGEGLHPRVAHEARRTRACTKTKRTPPCSSNININPSVKRKANP